VIKNGIFGRQFSLKSGAGSTTMLTSTSTASSFDFVPH